MALRHGDVSVVVVVIDATPSVEKILLVSIPKALAVPPGVMILPAVVALLVAALAVSVQVEALA